MILLLRLFVLFMMPSLCFSKHLSHLELDKGQKVGILLGTFDPLTAERQKYIEEVLSSNAVNALVLVPVDFTPHKPRRLSSLHRHKMIEKVYAESQSVFYADAYQYGFPESRFLTRHLKKQHPHLNFFAVGQNSDFSNTGIKSKISSWIARWLNPNQNWILTLSESGDAKANMGEFTDYIHVQDPQSSKGIKKLLFQRNHKNSKGELLSQLDQRVLSYVEENKLYLKKSSLCAMAFDIRRSLY